MKGYRINWDHYKLSRKAKRIIKGRPLNRSQIFQKYQRLVFHKHPKNIHEGYEFSGVEELFCPRCGCEEMKSSGNLVEYPELWEKCYCAHCEETVMMADNSPYIHILAIAKEVEATEGRFSKREFESFLKNQDVWL